MAYSNSYICAVGTPTLGLYVQSVALLGESLMDFFYKCASKVTACSSVM